MSDRNPEAGQLDFEKFIRKIVSPDRARYGLGMLLDFTILHDHITEVLEKNDLILLPYERLKNTPDIFLNEMLRFLDTPEDKIKSICTTTANKKANVRSGQENEVWKIRDTHNRIVKRLIPGWILQKKTKTIELTPDLKTIIRQAYSNGNQKLTAKTDLDLEQYGYLSFE